ncbi:MAG TPA: LexA family transcriptional repressor [Firmicutes bacterium]|nr:LexA family transcriptional repressor [Bacillota bacterium]
MLCMNIKKFRERKGLTQEELGRLVGKEKSTIGCYETGARAPRVETLALIAKALAVSMDELTGLSKGDYVLENCGAYFAESSMRDTAVAYIPVLGTISAGLPLTAEQHILDYRPMRREKLKDAPHFFLRVKGDSMSGDGILDGDLVLVRLQPEVENGEIAVVMCGNDEATLKRVYKYIDQVLLQPSNPRYPPRPCPPGDVRIIGKYTGHLERNGAAD